MGSMQNQDQEEEKYGTTSFNPKYLIIDYKIPYCTDSA